MDIQVVTLLFMYLQTYKDIMLRNDMNLLIFVVPKYIYVEF